MIESCKQYICPNCKGAICISKAEFIKGIAMVSCTDCGKNSFTIEETLIYI